MHRRIYAHAWYALYIPFVFASDGVQWARQRFSQRR